MTAKSEKYVPRPLSRYGHVERLAMQATVPQLVAMQKKRAPEVAALRRLVNLFAAKGMPTPNLSAVLASRERVLSMVEEALPRAAERSINLRAWAEDAARKHAKKAAKAVRS